MPLKELLHRILERRASLFICTLERQNGLWLALRDLDWNQRNDFITAVFDYHYPFVTADRSAALGNARGITEHARAERARVPPLCRFASRCAPR
jgi:hypothetical protein